MALITVIYPGGLHFFIGMLFNMFCVVSGRFFGHKSPRFLHMDNNGRQAEQLHILLIF